MWSWKGVLRALSFPQFAESLVQIKHCFGEVDNFENLRVVPGFYFHEPVRISMYIAESPDLVIPQLF